MGEIDPAENPGGSGAEAAKGDDKMPLTKSKGNMYSWVTHHWSPIRGCQFECSYCYVKFFQEKFKYVPPPGLDKEDLRTHLGREKVIFVGSKCDMWGPWVSDSDIQKVLQRCKDFPGNEYVFQSKDPGRFRHFGFAGINALVGTTIETDTYPAGFKTLAPSIEHRVEAMMGIFRRKFVTIEPIMDFRPIGLVTLIDMIRPDFVTIGADSKGHGLVEPPWEKVEELIRLLGGIKIEIRQKKNLDRLKKGA